MTEWEVLARKQFFILVSGFASSRSYCSRISLLEPAHSDTHCSLVKGVVPGCPGCPLVGVFITFEALLTW